jgi:hypothetical protein
MPDHIHVDAITEALTHSVPRAGGQLSADRQYR